MFYFQWPVEGRTESLVLVMPYGEPDPFLLENSFGAVWAAPKLDNNALVVIKVTSILAVSGMVPHTFITPHTPREGAELFFAADKLSSEMQMIGEDHGDEVDGDGQNDREYDEEDIDEGVEGIEDLVDAL